VPKFQHKPIKRSKLGFKTKEQKKPKRTLVWRTRLSGAPPDSVRCPGTVHAELFTFGFLRRHSAIIHRTVRWTTGLSSVPAEQRLQRNGRLQQTPAKALQCVDSSRRVRAAPEGAPDSEQWLSGVAPDCPVAQAIRAPTVKTVRTLTVGRPSTAALPNDCFGGWGYKYPQPPLFKASKFFRLHIQYKS
jgi:hypothetical protein